MEIELAKKLLELSEGELTDLLETLKMTDHDAFKALQELINDLL